VRGARNAINNERCDHNYYQNNYEDDR
jgi:hypothetical protein